jgi:hypothetical protein
MTGPRMLCQLDAGRQQIITACRQESEQIIAG